jgi:hypothetical protein
LHRFCWKERIVYLGLPLYSSDDVKRRIGIDVTGIDYRAVALLAV